MVESRTKKIFNDNFRDPYIGNDVVLHDDGFEAITMDEESGSVYRVLADGTKIDLDD